MNNIFIYLLSYYILVYPADSVSETFATTGGRRKAALERLFQLAGVEGRAGGLKDSPSGSARAKGAS